ncbi:MAG: DNA repair protein RadC [Clostridia bacterium]|nr:DNA repair protein RadC [Clostridia bacterium]
MPKKIPDMYERKNNSQYDFESVALDKKIAKKRKYVHDGHRERLRERFIKEGIENFDDHQVLELLLFYSIPRIDTNVIAHNLIDEFGSLPNVFNASIEDLCKVKGVGERSACLIKLMPQLFNKYETINLKTRDVPLNSAEFVAKYASKYFIGIAEERLYLMCLDSQCNLLNFSRISQGNIRSTTVNMGLIAKIAFENKATNLILVHNHPSGIMAPSKADVDVTIKVESLMHDLGMRLSDHIIIGNGDDYFSFRKSEKWKHIFR